MNNSTTSCNCTAKDYLEAVLEVLFSISKITSKSGNLTKSLTLDANGKLVKTPVANMTSGQAQTIETDLKGLADIIQGLGADQAIVHGTCGFDHINIVSQKNMNGQPGTITRTKEHFKYQAGPTLVMIDYDPDDGQPELSYQEVVAAIDRVCPGFKDVPKLLTRSTSSCISTTDGKEITGPGAGFHLYFVVQDGRDIERFKSALFQRLWIAGHGYIKISKAGSLLTRTIFDDAVMSPERLDFVSGAILGDGLIQSRPEPLFMDGTVSMLDSAECQSLQPDELSEYQSIVNAAKARVEPKAQAIREVYIKTETPKLIERHRDLGRELSPEQAEKILRARGYGQNADLYGDDVLIFDDLGAVLVSDVLSDPAKYDGRTLSDPFETDKGPCKARFDENAGRGAEKPVVHSFVHGGMVFFLHVSTPDAIEGLTIEDALAWIDSTDDKRAILKEWVDKVRGLDASEQDEVKQAVQDKTKIKISLLNSQLKEKQSEWIKETRIKIQADTSQKRQAQGIAEILYQVNGTGDACHAASKALRNSKEGLVYRYGGNLIKIVMKPPTSVRMVKSMADQGAEYPAMPLISDLNQETLGHELEKVAVLQIEKDGERIDIQWPANLLRGTMALTEYHEHNLVGIVEHPYVDYEFKPVTNPGYDPATGLYKCFKGQVPNLFKTADEALVYLCETVFADVPFADDDLDRFAAVSCLLTGMQRKLIVDGSGCPGYLFNAPVQSSGKTTLAQIISYSLYGRPAAASTFSDDDTEMAKHLLGILQEGQASVLFDNIQEGTTIESNELAKAITSDSYSNRWLGKNKTVTVPSSVLWLFTGNNVSVCGDFNTRILPVELDPRVANPDQRKFSRANIGTWCEQNRKKILSACLKVIMSGKDYEPPNDVNPSRFPTWDKFVRYPIYKIAGQDVAEIFQKNKLSDPKIEGQRAFFEAWFETFGTAPVTAKDVLIKCQTQTAAGDSLSEALLDIFPGGLPNTRGLGKWLNGMRNRFHGDLRLQTAGKVTVREQKHSVLWQVTKTD